MAQRELRILMVTNHFYPSVGGLEHAARRLASSLIAKGTSVTVLTPRFGNLRESETVDAIPIRRFPVIRSPHVRYDLYSKAVYAASLGAHLIRERWNYDVIHVHQALYAAVVCAAAGRLLKKPVIVKVAGSGPNGNLAVLRHGLFAGRLLLGILKQADIFISLSPDIEHELLHAGIQRTQIRAIPNGIALRAIQGTRRAWKERLGLNADDFTAIFAGRLGRQKHCHLLLDAWKRIVDRDSHAVLLLAGEGPDYQQLVAQAADLHLSDRVRFLGAVSNVAEWLSASDVFVLPSDSEGMSNALLEAQASGVPCIASNADGNRHMVEHGVTGLLCDLNVEHLADQLMFIRHHPDVAQGFAERARQLVEERFDIDVISNRYIDLYEGLVA